MFSLYVFYLRVQSYGTFSVLAILIYMDIEKNRKASLHFAIPF